VLFVPFRFAVRAGVFCGGWWLRVRRRGLGLDRRWKRSRGRLLFRLRRLLRLFFGVLLGLRRMLWRRLLFWLGRTPSLLIGILGWRGGLRAWSGVPGGLWLLIGALLRLRGAIGALLVHHGGRGAFRARFRRYVGCGRIRGKGSFERPVRRTGRDRGGKCTSQPRRDRAPIGNPPSQSDRRPTSRRVDETLLVVRRADGSTCFRLPQSRRGGALAIRVRVPRTRIRDLSSQPVLDRRRAENGYRGDGARSLQGSVSAC
jgi:hypothetical protein